MLGENFREHEHPTNNMRTILATNFILERPEEIFQLV